MNQGQIEIDEVLGLEIQMRLLSTELALLRELVRANPNYEGEWKNHEQFRRTRKRYLQVHGDAGFLKKKRR